MRNKFEVIASINIIIHIFQCLQSHINLGMANKSALTLYYAKIIHNFLIKILFILLKCALMKKLIMFIYL